MKRQVFVAGRARRPDRRTPLLDVGDHGVPGDLASLGMGCTAGRRILACREGNRVALIDLHGEVLGLRQPRPYEPLGPQLSPIPFDAGPGAMARLIDGHPALDANRTLMGRATHALTTAPASGIW